jgi:hypothetical protein
VSGFGRRLECSLRSSKEDVLSVEELQLRGVEKKKGRSDIYALISICMFMYPFVFTYLYIHINMYILYIFICIQVLSISPICGGGGY